MTAADHLMSRDQVAAHLGIDPKSVRKTMHRAGIREVRGYPRAAVEGMDRPGRGARTDLRPPPATAAALPRCKHCGDEIWQDDAMGPGWFSDADDVCGTEMYRDHEPADEEN